MTSDDEAKATGRRDRVKARHGNASEGPNGQDTQAREGIARIVDPDCFEALEWLRREVLSPWGLGQLTKRQADATRAREKADAILSLLKGREDQGLSPLAAKDASADAPLRPVVEASDVAQVLAPPATRFELQLDRIADRLERRAENPRLRKIRGDMTKAARQIRQAAVYLRVERRAPPPTGGDGWTAREGGARPVARFSTVDVKWSDGKQWNAVDASGLNWKAGPADPCSIIAYRLTEQPLASATGASLGEPHQDLNPQPNEDRDTGGWEGSLNSIANMTLEPSGINAVTCAIHAIRTAREALGRNVRTNAPRPSSEGGEA